ncbi:MAG: replication-associated recombination protein A [Acidimicrobiales bacterium]
MRKRSEPDLFDAAAADELSRRAPLAERMRPRILDEFVGQAHLLAPGATLRALIEADSLSSAIFFGPAGSGKTTLARLVAASSEKSFVTLSAVSSGVAEVRDVIEQARRDLGMRGRQTILFLDEIHRFNRAQQDAFLPGVEAGVIVLIGATTENPFFSLTSPLLSRSTLWRFEPIGNDDLEKLARRAVDLEGASITDEAITASVDLADGDARALLMTLEVAIAVARARDRGAVAIGREDVEAARTTRAIRHGRDEHYDVISALIKSIRGSDPDAAIYWLARLIVAGEDPRFVARRLVILASEDVGLADPNALVVAEAAAAALDRVGLPEAALNLAQAVVYLSTAPKSNRSAVAIWNAMKDVEEGPLVPVPPSLRGTGYRGAAALGHGAGYRYPHDDPRGFVEASYMPDELAGRRYYEPSRHGFEREVADRLAKWWKRASNDEDGTDPDTVTE